MSSVHRLLTEVAEEYRPADTKGALVVWRWAPQRRRRYKGFDVKAHKREHSVVVYVAPRLFDRQLEWAIQRGWECCCGLLSWD